jgi:general secretion pathway protein D
MDRIMKILEQLDVQGFEEQMEVIRVRYARAKDIADLVQQIINKGEKQNQFGGGVPRFRPAGTPEAGGQSGSEVFSVVVPDERTNSIIVVGNKAGIEKIRRLVSRLDYPMRPDEQGGFFVYYLRHAEAQPIADMLNGIASESKKAQDAASGGANRPPVIGGPGGQVQVGPSPTAIFTGDVKISADKNTNSIVIVASKPDYETVKRLIAKLDIAKDQVYIKAIIMEMSSNNSDGWNLSYYKFGGGTNGIGRAGFAGIPLGTAIDPTKDSGGIIGFGGGGIISMTLGGQTFQVPSLLGLINILKTNSNGQILSTPEVMALNNEESLIEVGEKVPVSLSSTTSTTGVVAPNVTRENVTTKLTITPYISPDTDAVKMKLEQEVAGISQSQQKDATELAKNALSTTTRKIKTSLVVNSGDTAVLGGLMKDEDTDNVTKIPVLGDIPIVGWLFKSHKHDKTKLNLMVFITPKIVRNPADGNDVLTNKINERIDFIQQNMNGRDAHGQYIDAITRGKKAAAPSPMKPSEPEAAPEEPAVESF